MLGRDRRRGITFGRASSQEDIRHIQRHRDSGCSGRSSDGRRRTGRRSLSHRERCIGKTGARGQSDRKCREKQRTHKSDTRPLRSRRADRVHRGRRNREDRRRGRWNYGGTSQTDKQCRGRERKSTQSSGLRYCRAYRDRLKRRRKRGRSGYRIISGERSQ